MGSPASRQLSVRVSGLSPETMTSAAVQDALRAHLGSARQIPMLSLQRGYEYVPCFEALWRAFPGDQSRALMPAMTAAGYVSVTLWSHRADGTLLSTPPKQGQPPKKKALVQPPPRLPPPGQPQTAPMVLSPPPAAFPPPPALPPQGSPRAPSWSPAPQPAVHPTMLPTAPTAWHPQGAATQAPGAPGGRTGGYSLPLHLPQGVRSPGPLRGLVMALLPDPTPAQVCALASVHNNLIRDAPPAPADPGQQGPERAGPCLPPLWRVVPTPGSG